MSHPVLPGLVSVTSRLRDLGIALPPAPTPVGSYVPVVVSGTLAFVSGQIARKEGAVLHPGKVGDTVTLEQAVVSAREAALAGLAAMRAEGLLDRISRVVKITGYVASAPGFVAQPKVVNGASDLLVQIFGDAGRHARAAIGVAALPADASVEVEFVFEVHP